jgi:hypothetical protein
MFRSFLFFFLGMTSMMLLLWGYTIQTYPSAADDVIVCVCAGACGDAATGSQQQNQMQGRLQQHPVVRRADKHDPNQNK